MKQHGCPNLCISVWLTCVYVCLQRASCGAGVIWDNSSGLHCLLIPFVYLELSPLHDVYQKSTYSSISVFFLLLFLSSLFPSCRMHQARSWKGRAGSKVWGLLKIYRFILFIMLHTVQIYLYSRVNNRRCHKAALQGSSCSCPHSKWKYFERKKKIVFGYPCETIRSSRSSK